MDVALDIARVREISQWIMRGVDRLHSFEIITCMLNS